MNPSQKFIWFLLMIALAGLLFAAFRGYLMPSLLLDFANSMLC